MTHLLFFFWKRPFLIRSLVEALERFEVGVKITVFVCVSTKDFLLGWNITFQKNVVIQNCTWFIWIWTWIWFFSLCKLTQFEESEMRLTGWTLWYGRHWISQSFRRGALTPKLTKRDRKGEEKHVMCHVSHVTWHVSHVTCHLSLVTCH